MHDTAHRLGIPTHCTLLYGHVETYEERIEHLLRLRDQQDRTGGFLAFIPLAFHPANTVFERRGFTFQTGAADLKMLAVSRLVLDNIPNIKAYWISLTLPVAQVALHFGANDVQGTLVREEIFRAAGSTAGTEQKLEELVRTVQRRRPDPGAARHALQRAAAVVTMSDRRRGRPQAAMGGAVIRLGRISYANMAPVFFRVEAEYEEVGGVPTELNRRLVAGEIDVAPISSIEYARHADSLLLLPRLCVSSRGSGRLDPARLEAPARRDQVGRRDARVGHLGRPDEGAAARTPATCRSASRPMRSS